MASEDEPSLETLLNKATNPMNRDEDWEFIMAFCDQINKELEGPQISVRLLAHKIQSPQEKEALYALMTLEACVKNCGKRFHQEIGKFRFLNEMIKVVSPKYLGNHTSEKVKKKVIELMYSWSQGLKHETKIEEAYQMLKRQNIVKEDPTYTDKTYEAPPSPKQKNTIFEDKDKSKLLARLLKSKHPEDLQAANRLIKNMVRQDAERMEKVSKRTTELETVGNNVKLLAEMLQHYTPGTASEADKDIMKELYENLEKQRPNLFRLASDTDEKDNEGINEILKANDNVMKIMTQYKQIVEGATEENGLLSLDDQSSNKGLNDSSENQPGGGSAGTVNGQSEQSKAGGDLDILGDLLSHNTVTTTANADDLFGLNSSSLPVTSAGGATGASLVTGILPQQPQHLPQQTPQPVMFPRPPQPHPSMPVAPMATAQPITSVFTQPVTAPANSFTALSSHAVQGVPAAAQQQQQQQQQKSALDELDILGKSLLQQSLPDKRAMQSSPTPKVPMNQMHKPASPVPVAMETKPHLAGDISQPTVKALAGANGSSPGSQLATPTGSATSSPKKYPTQNTKVGAVEVQSLSDIFVPLETIQPGTAQPLTAYDKNGMKIVIHFGKDSPRPDVLVMVVSTMTTNTSPVKNFTFLAAVPKTMRVKLQPPSATDLPAYNPILPPAAITQVMLVANPQKEKIRLKFKISYSSDNADNTDVGEVDNFPAQ